MELQTLDNEILKDSIYKDILVIPTDKVVLPSEAKLYGENIPPILDVEYMTSGDEDILYSTELMNSGQVFNTLLKKKVKNKIKIEDLLLGDFNTVLLALRINGYGNVYQVNTLDPDTNTMMLQDVDLLKLKIKPLTGEFDERGEFEFILPLLNKRITFKLSTVGMGDYINNRAEQLKRDNVTPYIRVRLETQIMSIEGQRDKNYISKFVNSMPPRDRIALMKYMDDIQPGIDLNYTFTSSVKENLYNEKIILGMDFFYVK
jgi:hypothetical protein